MTDLTDHERAVYEWQMWVADFGETGQRALKQATVLVSRVGGVGGTAAYYLAAAGVGRLILAHAGNIRPSDLNRQLLMTDAALGTSRVESAARRLRELNPRVEVTAVPENINADNVARLVGQADLICDCAPLFGERFLMNREAVRQGKPLVDSAMYDLEAQLTTVLPGRTPCLACLYPAEPPAWKRQFPVFGAVAGSIGSLAALEAIKVLAGFGEPLASRMLLCSLRDMTFRTVQLERNPRCAVCGTKDP
ncbi:MAG: HesA/MoeB/ThiF family protein [Planctomycetia bacterium]|nr:HesA/MoeB/ThiF family protein [Planctomycetia bacterium]